MKKHALRAKNIGLFGLILLGSVNLVFWKLFDGSPGLLRSMGLKSESPPLLLLSSTQLSASSPLCTSSCESKLANLVMPNVVVEGEAAMCSHNNTYPTILVMVHSAVEQRQHRAIIRAYINRLHFRWKPIFVLGLSRTSSVNERVRNEAHVFGDIVQGDFDDTYRNLTIKHLFGLSWAAKNCEKINYLLKVDDDIFVNYYRLKMFIEKFLSNVNDDGDRFIIGYVHRNMSVIRDRSSKWYTKQTEFAAHKYPEFCSGWAYLTSIASIRSLLCTATDYQQNSISFFWIDDVFVTGMLRPECVRLKAINHLFNANTYVLDRWLSFGGRFSWNYLFSNTENVKILRAALQLNHQRHMLEK